MPALSPEPVAPLTSFWAHEGAGEVAPACTAASRKLLTHIVAHTTFAARLLPDVQLNQATHHLLIDIPLSQVFTQDRNVADGDCGSSDH